MLVQDTAQREIIAQQAYSKARAIEAVISLSDDTALGIAEQVLQRDKHLGQQAYTLYELLIHVKEMAKDIGDKVSVIY